MMPADGGSGEAAERAKEKREKKKGQLLNKLN